MLADEICAQGLAEDSCYHPQQFKPMLARIAQAQKYVLTPQFAAVADALSEDYGSLVRAFPFCRLPYANVWLEVVHTDRPKFAASEIQAPGFQSRPSRIGFLLSATRDDLSAWKAHLFWCFKGTRSDGCNAASIAMMFDMTEPLTKLTHVGGERIDGLRPDIFTNKIVQHPGWTYSNEGVRLAMLNHTQPVISDYGVPYIEGIKPNEEVYDILGQLARSDWAGEVPFLLAVIGLLNARNATEAIPVEQRKLNKARVKRGQHPLFEHHTLRIHTRQQRRVGSESGQRHAAMRMHMCSGHWKVRRTGIYFWRPHWRGDPTIGKIHKTYEVAE